MSPLLRSTMEHFFCLLMKHFSWKFVLRNFEKHSILNVQINKTMKDKCTLLEVIHALSCNQPLLLCGGISARCITKSKFVRQIQFDEVSSKFYCNENFNFSMYYRKTVLPMYQTLVITGNGNLHIPEKMEIKQKQFSWCPLSIFPEITLKIPEIPLQYMALEGLPLFCLHNILMD